jgi:hypothetical protein
MIPSGSDAETTLSGEKSLASEKLVSTWGVELIGMVCERCDWSYLLPANESQKVCPHCFQSTPTPITEQIDQLPYIKPPELMLLFTFPENALSRGLLNFISGIPFAPIDMGSQTLQHRLNRMYLPMWLVDAEVKASWKAEAGFNYQVVSHQDRYDQNRGGWSSQEIEEGRIRWEPRLGRLKRAYKNISAPALEEHRQMKSALGDYDLSSSVNYSPEQIDASFVRLPNRAPLDAWTDAKSLFQTAAAEECRQAARSDHIRQFSWQPEFLNQNWTLLLLPVHTTFYLDDEGKPQVLLINGQTGRISGTRRASLKQGQRAALTVLVVAVIIFLLSLLVSAASLLLPVLLSIGVLGLVVALVVGLGSIIPIATVWWFNQSQPPG